MIDYDASLQKFFQLTIKYLQQRKKKAADKRDLKNIEMAIIAVEGVANDPKMFADYNKRVAAGIEDGDVADGFIGKSGDNSVYLVWAGVVSRLADLENDFDYTRQDAQKYLLNAIKTMSYKTSKNILKDFAYPFLPQKHFAVKSNENKR